MASSSLEVLLSPATAERAPVAKNVERAMNCMIVIWAESC